MSAKALGRRPPIPQKMAVALDLAPLFTGRVPPYPPNVDHLRRMGLTFGLYNNDVFGVCGPTSAANWVRLVSFWLTGSMVEPTWDQVKSLYKRSGNPDFDEVTGAGDEGVVMQVMLDAWRKGGFVQDPGAELLGFGRIDARNHSAIRSAIAIFGGVLYGVDLQTAQQSQTDAGFWDWKRSSEWGGHAVLGGEYQDQDGAAADKNGVVSWAVLVEMTDAFMTYQLDEVWVPILRWHISSKAFLEGVDQVAMAAAFEALTGDPFPVDPHPAPEPQPPTPDPVVPPAPVLPPELDETDQRLMAWLLHTTVGREWLKHGRHNPLARQQLAVWLEDKKEDEDG